MSNTDGSITLHSPKRRKLDHHNEKNRTEDLNPDLLDLGEETRNLSSTPSKFMLDENVSTLAKAPDGTSRGKRDVEIFAAYSGNSYNSSMFKLQINEMLAEVKRHTLDRRPTIDNALRKLKVAIEGINAVEPLSVQEALKTMQKSHKITVPFPTPKPELDAAYKLSYAKPVNINITGSYVLSTMTKDERNPAVDMVVTMPPSVLQEKDYLNHRYFYKRAYYLTCLAVGLQASLGDMFDINFGYLAGSTLHPILVLTPKKGDNDFARTKCRINIIPAMPESFFKDSKILPSKNCIRPRTSEAEYQQLSPTPFYNASLQVDSNFGRYLKLLHHTSKRVEGFQDACLLGRIWLRQRGFGGNCSDGGFGNFEWAALTALLLQEGGPKGRSILSSGYNSYQLFKGLLQYLAANNLITHPVLLQARGAIFPKSRTPMFYDGLRSQNLLFKMTPWSYSLLQNEAIISIEMLNDTSFDHFDATFILKKDYPLLQFDFTIQIPVSPTITSTDHSSPLSQFSSKVYEVLKEGLTDRVKLIHVKLPESSVWSLNIAQPCAPSDILVSVVFDPRNLDRVVDHGPAAENKIEAAAYRNFWGEKAELRRFKDGSILESIIWSHNEGGALFKEISTYLLKRHLGKKICEGAIFIGDGFSHLLPGSEDTTASFGKVMDAFRSIEQEIRNLEDLPLQVKQISGASAQLRFCSVLLPQFAKMEYQRRPTDIVVQFEGSGRWPDDIAAIQRMKIALLMTIGESLESTVVGLTSKLGIENSERTLLNCAYLDVLHPSGATFRLRIYNEREQTLLDRQIKDKSINSHARENAVIAKSVNARQFVQTPLHTQSVATHSTRFPFLSPSIRLVKMWFESHMLSNHIREEFIELLVMRTFLQPYPWQVPSSTATGFLRTLHFISRWDWRTTPLIVDFSGAMVSKDIDVIYTRFEAWRKIDPGMNRTVLFAASNHDATGTAFTEGGPSKVVAARMTSLARSACAVSRRSGLNLEPNALFRSPTNDYDFVIHISPRYSGTRRGNRDSMPTPYKNLAYRDKNDVLGIGYEPIQLLVEELQALYGSNIIFFYDALANSLITGLWNPQTSSRLFKVNIPYAIKPSGGREATAGIVELDRSSILSEIVRLGGDLISKIEISK